MALFYMNPFLIAAAIIPALVLLIKIYRADKIEEEPPKLLASLVIYGIVATAFAIVTEKIGMQLLGFFAVPGTVRYNAIMYFVVVAFSEEGFKYLFLKRKTWYHPAFNYQFDGVVYAVFISLGFAVWENLRYVSTYGMETALVRAITAVPGHACFGVFMGAWYGIAKKFNNMNNLSMSKVCRTMALLLPAFMHGCYDFAASMEQQGYAWIFIVFIVLMFFIALKLVKRLSNEDNCINEGYY